MSRKRAHPLATAIRALAFLGGAGVLYFGVAAMSKSAARNADVDYSELGSKEPRYGGTLNVGTVVVTLSPLSWDPADWVWKMNHDTGAYFEMLIGADLDKSVRKGGPYPFFGEAWLPTDAQRGELAESWEWGGPVDAGHAPAARRHVSRQARSHDVTRARRPRRGLELRATGRQSSPDPDLLRPHRSRGGARRSHRRLRVQRVQC